MFWLRNISIRRNPPTLCLPIARRNTSGKMNLRMLTSPQEIRREVIQRMLDRGRRPGALDHIMYFTANKTGFYVGEVDEKTVGCGGFVKYSPNYVHFGCGMVDNEYQGSGYGAQILAEVLAQVSEFNRVCTTRLENVPLIKKFGYTPYQEVHKIEFDPCNASFDTSNPVEIVRPSKNIFTKLMQYDTIVFVYERLPLMKKWIFAPNSFCSIAVSASGNIVGYGAVRSTLVKKRWKIGPLFADDSSVARMLLNSLCKYVSLKDSDAIIIIDVPHGSKYNEETLKIMAKCSGRIVDSYVYSYMFREPDSFHKKVFGFTTLKIG